MMAFQMTIPKTVRRSQIQAKLTQMAMTVVMRVLSIGVVFSYASVMSGRRYGVFDAADKYRRL